MAQASGHQRLHYHRQRQAQRQTAGVAAQGQADAGQTGDAAGADDARDDGESGFGGKGGCGRSAKHYRVAFAEQHGDGGMVEKISASI